MGVFSKAAALGGLIYYAGLVGLAPADAAPKGEMTAAEAALVRQALDRGALIYAYDRAAWLGTDDIRAKLPDFESKVAGWIVDGPADAPQLVFYDRVQAEPRMVYVADFKGAKLVSGRLLAQEDDRSLSPARKAMVVARQAAIDSAFASKAMFCSKAMPNTVVLPPATPSDPTLVYILTPQSTLQSIPLGGHNLVEVFADGKAGKTRPFTKSCMEMPIKEQGGGRPMALVVNHLLDPVPTEIHVFSSFAAGLPIYVSTRNGKRTRLWEAAGSRIRIVSDKPAR